MKKADMIQARIAACVTLFGFTYKGKEGHVDPYYTPGKGYSYLLWFDGDEMTVYSIDAVMTTPFFGGHALAEIADNITVTEW